jgi:uncharacterized membrane protein
MWSFLMSFSIGSAIGASRLGRFVRPMLKLFAVGILVAGLIYTYVVLNAVRERSHDSYVHSHSSH